MPAIGPAKVKSRNRRSGRTSANALIWRVRSARFRRRLSGSSVGASDSVRNAVVIGRAFLTDNRSRCQGRPREGVQMRALILRLYPLRLGRALLRGPLVEALGQAID